MAEVDRAHVTEYVSPPGPKDPGGMDRAHVSDYVSPEADEDATPPGEVSKAHIVTYVSPPGPKDPGGMDRAHVRNYVAPVPDPEDEPAPDPVVVARLAREKEIAEHAELIRRVQEEDQRKIADERAAESVEPTSIEGQD